MKILRSTAKHGRKKTLINQGVFSASSKTSKLAETEGDSANTCKPLKKRPFSREYRQQIGPVVGLHFGPFVGAPL